MELSDNIAEGKLILNMPKIINMIFFAISNVRNHNHNHKTIYSNENGKSTKQNK